MQLLVLSLDLGHRHPTGRSLGCWSIQHWTEARGKHEHLYIEPEECNSLCVSWDLGGAGYGDFPVTRVLGFGPSPELLECTALRQVAEEGATSGPNSHPHAIAIPMGTGVLCSRFPQPRTQNASPGSSGAVEWRAAVLWWVWTAALLRNG